MNALSDSEEANILCDSDLCNPITDSFRTIPFTHAVDMDVRVCSFGKMAVDVDVCI